MIYRGILLAFPLSSTSMLEMFCCTFLKSTLEMFCCTFLKSTKSTL